MDESEVTVRATQSIAGFVEGEIVTVVRSRFVDRLIAQESLVVVGEPAEAVGTIESGLISTTPSEVDPNTPGYSDASHLQPKPDNVWVIDGKYVPPKKGASRETWANFLTAVEVEFPVGAKREALVAIYEANADDIDLAYTATTPETVDPTGGTE